MGLERINNSENTQNQKVEEKPFRNLRRGRRGAIPKENRSNTLLKELLNGMMKYYKELGRNEVKSNIFGNLAVVGFVENKTLYCTFLIAEEGTGFRVSDVVSKLERTGDIRVIPKTIASMITSKYNEAKEFVTHDLKMTHGEFSKMVPFILSVPNNIELNEKDIEDRALFSYNLPYYACLKDSGEIVEDSLKEIKARLDKDNKDFKLELFNITSDSQDLNRNPIRTEWALDVEAPEGEGLDSVLNPSSGVISSVSGYINILPEQYIDPMTHMEYIGFSPNVVLTSIDTRSLTLGENLLGIASSTVLRENANWIKPLLSKTKQLEDLNKLAKLEFKKGVDNPSSIISKLINRPIVFSVDFVTHGTTIVNANALLGAARGNVIAEKDTYEAFDELLDGEFSKVFDAKEKMFLRSVRLPVGYFKDNNTQEYVSLDNVDSAFIIRTRPKDYMRLLVMYVNSQIDQKNSYMLSLKLYHELGIDAYVTGEKFRATLNPRVVDSMITALHQCGFKPTLDNPYVLDTAPTLGMTMGVFSQVGFTNDMNSLTQQTIDGGLRSYNPSYYDPLYRR